MGGRPGYIGWGRKDRGGGQRVFTEMTALKDKSRGIFLPNDIPQVLSSG